MSPQSYRGLEPVPDDALGSWRCPICNHLLDILSYRSWVDGSPGLALYCPACQWVESDRPPASDRQGEEFPLYTDAQGNEHSEF